LVFKKLITSAKITTIITTLTSIFIAVLIRIIVTPHLVDLRTIHLTLASKILINSNYFHNFLPLHPVIVIIITEVIIIIIGPNHRT
jgi:hypothetical protein